MCSEFNLTSSLSDVSLSWIDFKYGFLTAVFCFKDVCGHYDLNLFGDILCNEDNEQGTLFLLPCIYLRKRILTNTFY